MLDMAETEVLAWHFTGDKLRDGRAIPPVGEWLVHDGKVRICERGLHASERLLDALEYAPGNMLHRVTMRWVADRQNDKLVGRERRIEWSLDAEAVLRAFARRVALDVLPLLPDAPPIVREYLETGREDIRAAACDAACDAALAAARAAACDAACDAALAAARAAARAAAWDAAWDAAMAAARAAAWDAAWDAACDAARAAARAAACDAACDAALAAARAAARDKYNGWLVEMVEAAR